MTVMLVKHDKPTKYEEAMVELSPRNVHEPYIILDKIHVWLPSGDLGRSSRWPQGRYEQMEFYEKIDADGIATSIEFGLSRSVFRRIQRVDHNEILSQVAKLVYLGLF